MEGKTVIAIAHRLSTIARMDRLVVLDQGRIVEQGTHDALLRLNGHYALLWRHQSGGFLPELSAPSGRDGEEMESGSGAGSLSPDNGTDPVHGHYANASPPVLDPQSS